MAVSVKHALCASLDGLEPQQPNQRAARVDDTPIARKLPAREWVRRLDARFRPKWSFQKVRVGLAQVTKPFC